jgi:membrane-bound serine protease (ClpP class)
LPENGSRVFIIELKGDIDPRTNRYTELALEEAADYDADIVIVEMDTYGGVVTDADDIRTRFLNYEKPLWVFINKDAASAGALISLACDSIYMAKGASIGAATVVNGTDGAAAPDKYQSYMRSIMRATAEANGRDPRIAEAMVDENLAVDSISTSGQVITFSTSEAIKWGYCEGQVESIEDLLSRNGIENYQLKTFELSWAEKLIALVINPFVSGILILIIIGGLYFELQTPGVGFPILASAIALVLYLVPYYLNGIAEYWEVIMFFAGLALIALEVFVIPGFGIAGISGFILTFGSLILMMINNDNFDFSLIPFSQIISAMLSATIGLLGGVLLIVFGGIRFTQSKAFRRIALEEVQDRKAGYTAAFREESLVGQVGIAYTVLRPSGKVKIGDRVFDAYTRGDYISAGDKILVMEDNGNSLKVQLVEE